MITTGKKNYDMIVIGVEAPGNIARIGQLFSSSEAGDGVNFSNIQSKNLDDLFETLRSSTLTGVVATTKKQITDLMEKESFFLPISSPMHTLYIDRNLKGITSIETFPDVTTIVDVLRHVSIKDSYTVKTDGK